MNGEWIRNFGTNTDIISSVFKALMLSITPWGMINMSNAMPALYGVASCSSSLHIFVLFPLAPDYKVYPG